MFGCDVFICVHLFVGLSAGSHDKYQTDINKTFCKGHIDNSFVL